MGWCDTKAFCSGEISIVKCPTVFSRGISWFGDWVLGNIIDWIQSFFFSFTFGWIVAFDPIFVLFCPFQLSLQASRIFCFFLPDNWHSSSDAPHPFWFIWRTMLLLNFSACAFFSFTLALSLCFPWLWICLCLCPCYCFFSLYPFLYLDVWEEPCCCQFVPLSSFPQPLLLSCLPAGWLLSI